MDLDDIARRTIPPEPWAEGDNIPWNDPGFSERMLREHLSQAHDAASRRFETIDEEVRSIHNEILRRKASRILDLGCGPGLYANRLAAMGHTVTGIDYSPSSIAYAVDTAKAEGSSAEFIEADFREATLGDSWNLVMLIFGEFNVFNPEDAASLLARCASALAPGGVLLLELSTFEGVAAKGDKSTSWYTAPAGLWSDRPHLCLQESLWNEDTSTTTVRYFIVDLDSGNMERYAVTYQAYRRAELEKLMVAAGLVAVQFRAPLHKRITDTGMIVMTARRRPKA